MGHARFAAMCAFVLPFAIILPVAFQWIEVERAEVPAQIDALPRCPRPPPTTVHVWVHLPAAASDAAHFGEKSEAGDHCFRALLETDVDVLTKRLNAAMPAGSSGSDTTASSASVFKVAIARGSAVHVPVSPHSLRFTALCQCAGSRYGGNDARQPEPRGSLGARRHGWVNACAEMGGIGGDDERTAAVQDVIVRGVARIIEQEVARIDRTAGSASLGAGTAYCSGGGGGASQSPATAQSQAHSKAKEKLALRYRFSYTLLNEEPSTHENSSSFPPLSWDFPSLGAAFLWPLLRKLSPAIASVSADSQILLYGRLTRHGRSAQRVAVEDLTSFVAANDWADVFVPSAPLRAEGASETEIMTDTDRLLNYSGFGAGLGNACSHDMLHAAVGDEQLRRMLVFVPSSPLVLGNTPNSQHAFEVPRWGMVALHTHANNSTSSASASASSPALPSAPSASPSPAPSVFGASGDYMRLASAHEMKPSIGALVAHMRGMFGLRREDAFGEMVGHPAGARGSNKWEGASGNADEGAEAGVADWELDALLRATVSTHLSLAGRQLHALREMTAALPQMAVPAIVAAKASCALELVKLACRPSPGSTTRSDLPLPSPRQRLALSRLARALAEAAVSEPSTLAEENLFFPEEYKIAVFAPLLVPLLLPMLTNAMRVTQEWRANNRKKQRQQYA